MRRDTVWCTLFVPALLSFLVLLFRFMHARPHLGYVSCQSARCEALFDASVVATSAEMDAGDGGGVLEVLSDGHAWTEGPVWVWDDDGDRARGYVLFSDVQRNRVWKWEEGGAALVPIGRSLHIDRAGSGVSLHDITSTATSTLLRPGSNGLARDPVTNNLVLAQYEARRVAMLLPDMRQVPLASTTQEGQRLNGPDDLAFGPTGDLYFTDACCDALAVRIDTPETGAPTADAPHHGIYRVSREKIAARIDDCKATPGTACDAEADAELVSDAVPHPNGIAFNPDYDHLYVSSSSEDKPMVTVFDVDDEHGTLSNPRTFVDLTVSVNSMAVDMHGNVFLAVSGGVYIYSPDANLLGRIDTGAPTSNVAFGGDGHLYITSASRLLRIPVRTAAAPQILLGQETSK